jgi:hypothetical protein
MRGTVTVGTPPLNDAPIGADVGRQVGAAEGTVAPIDVAAPLLGRWRGAFDLDEARRHSAVTAANALLAGALDPGSEPGE